MKEVQIFYKDSNNNIHCFDIEDNKDFPTQFLRDDFVQITNEEAQAIANPPPTKAELDKQKETENTAFLLSETRRTNDAIEVLNDAIEFEEATDEEVAQHKSLRKYRLDLSRVPNQETWPLNPVWAACPEFFKTKE